jgi:hypothetical protein
LPLVARGARNVDRQTIDAPRRSGKAWSGSATAGASACRSSCSSAPRRRARCCSRCWPFACRCRHRSRPSHHPGQAPRYLRAASDAIDAAAVSSLHMQASAALTSASWLACSRSKVRQCIPFGFQPLPLRMPSGDIDALAARPSALLRQPGPRGGDAPAMRPGNESGA